MTRSSSNLLTFGLGVAAILASASTARAQDPEAVRRQFMITVPQAASGGTLAEYFRGAPGTNTGTPLAFGPAMGDVFFAGGYENKVRNAKLANGSFGPDGLDDGSVSFGFGLGDANDLFGFATVVTSLSPFKWGLGNQTALSFQAFHNIDPTLAVAVGVESAIVSGGRQGAGDESYYAVVSKVFVQPSSSVSFLRALTMSVGAGNGRFRMIDDVRTNNKTINAFGSVAALVHEQVSVIADYTGQDINVGLSVVPFKWLPVAITPALADITGTASARARLIIGAGFGLHF